jgi:hypothetical protein
MRIRAVRMRDKKGSKEEPLSRRWRIDAPFAPLTPGFPPRPFSLTPIRGRGRRQRHPLPLSRSLSTPQLAAHSSIATGLNTQAGQSAISAHRSPRDRGSAGSDQCARLARCAACIARAPQYRIWPVHVRRLKDSPTRAILKLAACVDFARVRRALCRDRSGARRPGSRIRTVRSWYARTQSPAIKGAWR